MFWHLKCLLYQMVISLNLFGNKSIFEAAKGYWMASVS